MTKQVRSCESTASFSPGVRTTAHSAGGRGRKMEGSEKGDRSRLQSYFSRSQQRKALEIEEIFALGFFMSSANRS